MTRILFRAHKSPFTVATATETLTRNLIGNNVGNLVFAQSAYRLLSTRDAELDPRRLTRLSAGYINDHYDVAVVPLANAFRPSFLRELDVMSDLFEKLTIPVVVLGVGAQAPLSGEADSPELDETVTRFVRSVLNRSASMGVRGEVTAAYLNKLGFGEDVIDVIGCPSMFMDGPNLRVAKKVDRLTTFSPISLNISPYLPRMGPIAVDHAERYPNLIYTAQDHLTLGLMLNGVYEAKNPPPEGVPASLDHPLIRDNRVRFCLDPITWMRHLATFDFSFGSRIHGNIIALLAGTPALVLAHDSRTLELADYHQIPRRLLNRTLKRPDAARLYAKADWQPMMDGHPERWERMAAFLARNNLHHVYEPGESPEAFDTKLASIEFPPPVQMGMRNDLPALYEMQRAVVRLRSQVSQMESALAAEKAKHNRLRKAAGRLKRAVTSRLDGLRKRPS